MRPPPGARGARAPRPRAPGRRPRARARRRRPSTRARPAHRGRRGGRGASGDGRSGCSVTAPSFSLSSSTIRSAVFLPIPRDRLEAGVVAERDRLAQLGGAASPETTASATFGPDPADGQQVDEELALVRVGEAVELERVLAHVEVRLDRDLAARLSRGAVTAGSRRRGSRPRSTSRTRPSPLRPAAGPAGARSRRCPHDAHAARAAASAWQIATASASASCDVARLGLQREQLRTILAPGPSRRGRSRTPPA